MSETAPVVPPTLPAGSADGEQRPDTEPAPRASRWSAPVASLQDAIASASASAGPPRSSDASVDTAGSDQEQASASIGRKRSRWDSTPAPAVEVSSIAQGTNGSGAGVHSYLAPDAPTPVLGTGMGFGAATPAAGFDLAGVATPTASQLAGLGAATPVGAGAGTTYGSGSHASSVGGEAAGGGAPTLTKFERELLERNKPLSDEELDALLPAEGYMVLEVPQDYKPLMTPTRKLLATPTPAATPGFTMQDPDEETTGTGAADGYGMDADE